MVDSKIQAQKALADLRADLDKLVEIHKSYCRSAEAMATASQGVSVGASSQGRSAGAGSSELMAATRQMQEMNQSFSHQYLQLQQKMQSENRKFTTISNIMKTKHDTAKNAINNVR